MSLRRAGAALILVILLVTPFYNWRLGALLWMCAWVVHIVQISLAPRPRADNTPPDGEDD